MFLSPRDHSRNNQREYRVERQCSVTGWNTEELFCNEANKAIYSMSLTILTKAVYSMSLTILTKENMSSKVIKYLKIQGGSKELACQKKNLLQLQRPFIKYPKILSLKPFSTLLKNLEANFKGLHLFSREICC